MAKKENSAFVQMPSSTVAALKAMLFNSNNGVDLSSVIDDIAGESNNKDLVAINVALAYKGHKPELDPTERIFNTWEWGGEVTVASMTHVSLITGKVEVSLTEHKYDPNTKTWTKQAKGNATMSMENWYESQPATEENEVWEKIEGKQNKKYEEDQKIK